MTSVPLEVGNVVHDVIEAFLWRLQKSDSDIDESRFFQFAQEKADEYFSKKNLPGNLLRAGGGNQPRDADKKISDCLKNFIGSPVYTWIFMKAITNKDNWMIEPPGMGETRLNGLKAYCKMDFLFPVDNEIHILDWKTGAKDTYKHSRQLIGYAAAAGGNFGIPPAPYFRKSSTCTRRSRNSKFRSRAGFPGVSRKGEGPTEEMQSFCADAQNNTPKPIEEFP